MQSKIIIASLALTSGAVCAQPTVVPSAPVVIPSPPVAAIVPVQAAGNVLRVGTPVPVVLSEHLTTKGKNLKVGQRVQLEVAQDVLLNGKVAMTSRASSAREAAATRLAASRSGSSAPSCQG